MNHNIEPAVLAALVESGSTIEELAQEHGLTESQVESALAWWHEHGKPVCDVLVLEARRERDEALAKVRELEGMTRRAPEGSRTPTADELAVVRKRWEGVGPWCCAVYEDEWFVGVVVDGHDAPMSGAIGPDDGTVLEVIARSGVDGRPEHALCFAAAPTDIRTLQAALDAEMRRGDDTDARLLVAYRALEMTAEHADHPVTRARAKKALSEIDRMKAEGEGERA